MALRTSHSLKLNNTTAPRRNTHKIGRTNVRAMAASQDELKKLVGYKAVDDHVKSGMTVGLGTGSTAAFAVERVGQLLKDGTLKDIMCIPTSVRTKEQAEELGIPLCTLNERAGGDVVGLRAP